MYVLSSLVGGLLIGGIAIAMGYAVEKAIEAGKIGTFTTAGMIAAGVLAGPVAAVGVGVMGAAYLWERMVG
jgi:hypothetical protein